MIKQDNNVWEQGSSQPVDNDPVQPVRLRTNSFDIDFRRVISIWPYILLFGLLGYLVGSIYLRYLNFVYIVNTSLTIEQREELSIGQAFFGSQRDPFNDKIAYFRSPSLAAKLVDSLGLQYVSEAQGRFKNKDFYGIIKWHIVKDPGEDVPEINFSIMPKKDGFHFISESVEGNAKWDEGFYLKGYKIVVNKLQEFNSSTPIFCYSRGTLATAFHISGKINMTTTKESNIINISYADVSNERAIDILNGLISIYNNELKRDKSLSFSQAINFIDKRMIPLGRELDSIESALASFKASRGFVGMSANGELYLDKMKEYDKQLTEINILKATVSSIERFIHDPNLKESDLSFVGVNDPYLQGILRQYQDLRSQRDKLALVQTDDNPNMQVLDRKLNEMRSSMNSVLLNYKNNLRIAETTYQANISQANQFLRNTPNEEKELLEKSRLQNIKEQLFLTLLQKREEASIAAASVTVNTKILRPPLKINAELRPSRSIILMASFIIGLLLPLIFAIIKELTNRKVISKKQLQGMSLIPVIAELERADNSDKEPIIIGRNRRSMFGEQIRSLRTNINFYRSHGRKTNYVLITSSVSGEGKSFLSMNLAKSYSLQGKKVALLEFDLRRPKISKALSLPGDGAGLSSVLIGKAEPNEIAIRVGDDPKERLDVFPAGAIPPNPQELIAGEFIGKVKKYLDENYDVVIIDTPPFGIVADAQILGDWADVTLIVTRFQQTVREQIQEINEWYNRNLFKSMALVFNGVRDKGYFGSKYGNYYYRRKYGYGYYSSDTGTDAEKKS